MEGDNFHETYSFPAQKFDVGWELNEATGNISVSIAGSSPGHWASYSQQFYASDASFVIDGMRFQHYTYTAGIPSYDFHQPLAHGFWNNN